VLQQPIASKPVKNHQQPSPRAQEAEANFRVTVLGEQCDVKDGGEWDERWEKKQ
jgi:hypothetical protein